MSRHSCVPPKKSTSEESWECPECGSEWEWDAEWETWFTELEDNDER